VKEIKATQLLPVILNLAEATGHLHNAIAFLAADRKAEVRSALFQVHEDLDKILSATQQLLDQLSTGDAV
jgi:3-deoxy-D-arabino-heptulosonate 7-phosphate (DAHP) synthase